MARSKTLQNFVGALVLGILSGSVLLLSYYPSQSDFASLISLYFIAFICYLFLLSSYFGEISLKSFLGFAIVLRIALVFVFPQLSDDIYRFIWDGNLIHAGYNPYASLPSEHLSSMIPGNDSRLFALLNSPNYYTVYPPIAQLVYYIGTMGSGEYFLSSVLMKVINNTSDIITLFLIISILKRLKLPQKRVLIYGLNPLVLIELCGNLHMEAIMIMTFFGFVLFTIEERRNVSAVLLGTSIATKLMPLLFLPLIWKYYKQSKIYLVKIILILLVLFSPILLGFEWLNFGQSLDLYFGKFEFNGGIYSVLRYLGQEISGHNLIRYIGPGMALFTLSLLFTLYRKQRVQDLNQFLHYAFYIITCHYFLSTTVHPWYLSFPLALSLFTRYRFMILWSALIMLSYINYSYIPYRENFVMMAIEYIPVLAYMIYEIKKGN